MTTDIRTFGRVLGETARAVQKSHLQLLAREGSDFESWVVYLLLAEQGAAVPGEGLVNDLAKRLELEPARSRQVLDRLVLTGNIRTFVDNGAELVELTPTGQKYFAQVRESVGQLTQRLIGHLDPEDVATTIEVLSAVRAGAGGP